jgi:methyl-accepting chemotaxis protein
MRVKRLVEEVSGASQEQTIGIRQISKTLEAMTGITQNVASDAEASALAGEKILLQADLLGGIVERLESLV